MGFMDRADHLFFRKIVCKRPGSKTAAACIHGICTCMKRRLECIIGSRRGKDFDLSV